MRIVHIAVWTRDLETMRVFYERYFSGRSGEKYVNRAKGFESYMVRLGDTALELMRSARIADRAEQASVTSPFRQAAPSRSGI